MEQPTYRDGINRAAEEVLLVCDRLDKSQFGESLYKWLLSLPDDPNLPHPESPR